MTTEPFFSIITITRNNHEGLRRTRASIVTQDCLDYEWIIIDGASTDETAAFLPHCPAIIVSEPDTGIYDAMNKGLDRARGIYVICLNAGDTFASGKTLSRIKNDTDGNRPDFIYGDALETTPAGQVMYKKARKIHHARQGMITHHQAMLYRREAIATLRFNDAYTIAADFDFTLRFLSRGASTYYCPFPVCVFEPGGISQRSAWRGRCEQYRARASHGIKTWENTAIFAGQSAVWALRRMAPVLYWPLKARG